MSVIYCRSADCPYTDCMKHQSHLKEGTGYFAKLDVRCKKYLSWLAYSNYEKYRELKGEQNG